jgi:large subunit ribosomal protein L4
MPKATVYNMAGQSVGEVELSEAIFGVEPNEAVLHEVVKNHLANLRQGTQSALTRGEVSGGGKKPYRQKGTGRARQGSTRAVQWTHGGVAFAPKPRTYRYTVNKKVRRLALKSALSAKAAAGSIIVVDDLNMDAIKTKEFKNFLTAVGVDRKALIVTPELRETIVKSARNIPGIQTTTAKILSVYDILNAQRFVVDKNALAVIEEVFAS